jgi:hypothetical protein
MKHQIMAASICLAFVVFSASALADISDGLVAYWPFDEGAGNVAADLSGNGHDGVIEGAEWTNDAQVGSAALLFDGQGKDRVVLGGFDVEGGTGITIAFWMKASNLDTPGNDPRMASKAVGGASDQHWFMVSSGRTGGIKVLRFRLKTDGATGELKADTTTGIIDLDVWIHVAATWDGTDMKLYKNGVEVGSMPKGGVLDIDPSVNAAIGNQPDGAEDRPFEGVLDDVAIWNRGLSEAEVNGLMTGDVLTAVRPAGKLTTTWGEMKD